MRDILYFARNYLTVFEVASPDSKGKLGSAFLLKADEIAQLAGCKDLVELADNRDAAAWELTLSASRERFLRRDKVPTAERFYCAAYALTHLVLLNATGALKDHPEEAAVARMGAQLYSAEYSLRLRRG